MDDARLTPLVLMCLDGEGDPGKARPRAAVVVQYPGTPQMREAVMQGLQRQGWELVICPLGEFIPSTPTTVEVRFSNDQILIEGGGEIIYTGALPLAEDEEGQGWVALAQARREIAVLVTVGHQVRNVEEADAARNAGNLVGVAGTLR